MKKNIFPKINLNASSFYWFLKVGEAWSWRLKKRDFFCERIFSRASSYYWFRKVGESWRRKKFSGSHQLFVALTLKLLKSIKSDSKSKVDSKCFQKISGCLSESQLGQKTLSSSQDQFVFSAASQCLFVLTYHYQAIHS